MELTPLVRVIPRLVTRLAGRSFVRIALFMRGPSSEGPRLEIVSIVTAARAGFATRAIPRMLLIAFIDALRVH